VSREDVSSRDAAMLIRIERVRRDRRAAVAAGAACIAGLLMAGRLSAQPPPSPPERAVAEFLRALSFHDVAAFDRLSLPHPRARQLLMIGELTPEAKARAERNLENLQLHSRDDFAVKGNSVDPDANGDYPVGAVGHFIAASNGGPALVTLVRQQSGWKVDLRWWATMAEMAQADRPPSAGSPDAVIRELAAAMISLHKEEAARLVVPGSDLELLFAYAPSQPEPSDVLAALVMEMPLVEVGPGEFYRMPTGRIVEGVTSSDRKVIVGQFGSVEMPFVLRRVNEEWRVEAEPYYVLFNR